MKQTAVLWMVMLAVGLAAGQYATQPSKGKKHRTTTTTTENPAALGNEIAGPFPFPDAETSAGAVSFSSSSAGSSNLPGSSVVTGGSYWWAGPNSPFKPGSQPTGSGCGGPGGPGGCSPRPQPPPPPPSTGGCGGPAGCTGLGTDPRPSPAEPPSKPVDIENNPFLSSAILGKPIPSGPQGCQGGSGGCQYPGGSPTPGTYPGGASAPEQYPTQYPGSKPTGQYLGQPSGTGPNQYPGSGPTQYPGGPGSPAKPTGQYPGQPIGTGPTQYPGQPTGSGPTQYPGISGGKPTGQYPAQPIGAQYPGQPQYPGGPGSPSKPTGQYPGQPSSTGPTHYPGTHNIGQNPQEPDSFQFPGRNPSGSQYPEQPTGFNQYPGGSSGPSQYPGGSAGPNQYPQYPGQSSRPGTGARPNVPLRPQCSAAGHACVPSQMCVGGTITPGGMNQIRDPQIKECIPGLEACCKMPTGTPFSGPGTPRPGYGQSTTPRPYTGPLNTTPYPGCAAALKCVAESYCTAEGVMSDTPVYLTREQQENKVPLSDCQDMETGIIGKCCRDPNYKDPWPAGMMMGVAMLKPGDFDDGQYHGEGSGPTVSIGPSYNTISSTPQTPSKDHGPKPSDRPGGYNKPFPPSFPGNTPSGSPYTPGKPQVSGPGSYQPGKPSGTPYQPGQPSQSPYQPGQPSPTGTYQPGQPSPTGTYQPGQPSPTGSYQPGQPRPTGTYQPGQPSPTGTYQPGQPSPTGSYQPNQPSYQPGQPSPTGSYQPGQPSYQPGQPSPTGSYQPGQPSYQPGQSSPTGSYQPGQPSPTGTSYQPGQPSPTGQFQPDQPHSTGPIEPAYQPGEPNPSLPTHPGHQDGAQDQGPAPGSSCGIRRPGPGGDVAGFAEFPWQALVVSAGNRSLLCGAAIIAENAVITAAHCVNGLQAKDLLVKAGEWKLLAQNPKPVQVRPVAAIARHPGYNSGSLAKDLSILVLAEPFVLDVHVDKICIPPSLGSEYFQQPGQNCLITGWGKNALLAPVQGSDLHKVDVSVIPAKQCEAKLKTSQNLGKYFILNEGFSCALPPSPTDLCKVDFGSAVACSRPDGHYELAGVNSWDIACPTKQPLPSVFATSDAQWINTILSTPVPVLQAQEDSYNQSLLQGEQIDGVDTDDKPGFSQGYGK